MKKLIVLGVVVGVGVVLGSTQSSSARSSLNDNAPIELVDATQCWQTCQRCQEPCNNKPAGSARDNCKEACSASAAACCSSAGRKPPNHLTCTCGM